ncbi:MAG: helix-turn-helix domain-containing protein, partial [Schwartzia sp.]|nr:helix-turn-helix domain-containing protein [Schwartzia sp. (in: firmicutes)]
MTEQKTLTVKEVAEQLGLSEYTVRKKIRDGEIEGDRQSNRAGYQIPWESFRKYAEQQDKTLGSLWSKAALVAGSSIVGRLIGGPIGGFVGGLVTGGALFMNGDKAEAEGTPTDFEDLDELKDPELIEKIIERLGAEMDEVNIRIEYAQYQVDEAATPEEKKEAMQSLMENKLEYSRLNKQVKDLEIKKTLLMKKR